MKTNKLLKSSMSVALALTISSITDQAWPTNSNIAKANFGDKAATEQTKAELNEIINKIFNDQSITNRYLGTTFFHKTSNFPYYHVTFENHQVPDDVIDTTPWYNMWSEAAAAKAKLDANSYTEKTAQNAINTLKYYIQLYNFDVNHDLKDDGFYTTTDFKTPTMVTVSSDGQQDFYKKVVDNKEEIKNLFKESLVGIYKQGQDIEINLVANPDKVSKITSFVVNKVSGLDTNVKLGPSAEDQHLVAFSVPGELKAEQLVVSNMTYIDKNGVKQQTGPFALDINYSAAKKSNEAIPKYKEKLNEKIQNWIDRGNKVNEWLLTKENTSDTAADFSQRAKISEAVTKLQELKRSDSANYDKLYEISTPIHEMEDIATLREVLDIKVAKLLEYFDLYNEKTYTKESIEKYKNYIKSVPSLKNTRNIKELVQLIKDFDNANFTYLRYNTTELKRIIDIADRKIRSEYEPVSLEKFDQALNHAKDWINQTNSYNPQINETSDLVKQLTEAINNLTTKDGRKGEPVPPAPVENTTAPVAPYNVTAKFVERGSDKPIKAKYSRDLTELIKNVEVHELGNGKNEVILTLEPKITGGAIDFALADTFKYNSLGNTDANAEVIETKNIGGRDYPTKLKLIVDATKKNIEIALLGNFNFKDSFYFGNNGIENFTKPTDLYIDYSTKLEAKKESPLKASLRDKINYYTSNSVQDNYKDLKPEFKTSFNQLITKAQQLLNNDSLTKDEVDNIINKLLDETTKLDSLANLYKSLQNAKNQYENDWKNNSHFTSESKALVKEKLDAVESKINSLDPVDIEGKKETYSNEFDKEGTVTVYKKLDELTGEVQHLGDYLRINTEELSGEIKKAEEAYNNFNKITQSKLKLRQLIDEAKAYVEHAKLTPDSNDTDDQVNTDLTDYYKEQFKFAIEDLNGSQSSETEQVSAKEQLKNKIAEVELIKQGKKEPAAYVTLTNELSKAKELLNNESSTEEALLAELNKLNNAVNAFNNSADSTQNKPSNPSESPSTDSNNKVQLDGSLLKQDLTSPSMANGIIKNVYLVTENGKNYLELDLVPMNNGTTNVAVMSKLTYFDGDTEKDVQVLKEDTADVTYNNVTNSYKYPSKIRIPIEGKPSTIKLNTFASSTLFGTDKHENIAVLSVKYPKENAVITADKKQLNALFEATTSKYYDSWNNVFKNANVSQDMAVIKNFGNKINAAQNVLKNNIASTEEISTAFTELSDLKNQYDLLIQLRTSNAEAVANFNSDKDSKNYSEESINAVDNYLQGKIDKLEDLVHNNPKSNEILKLFNDVQTYYNLLRYDTSKLDTAVKSAQDKLAASNYSDESKNNLTTAITKATEFINKAKETRNLEDTRSSLLKEIEDAVNGLKEAPAPEVNKPSDNTNASNNEANKPNDKVDTPNNSEVNKPNDKVDTPTNSEVNKPNDKVDTPTNSEVNKPNDKVDTPANSDANKPNDKVDTPSNNKPTENDNDEVAKKLATERANILLPLETAKILVNDDKDKEGVNKEAYAKLKEATEKAQKVYDEEKSIDKILEGRSNIDKALEEYTKHKNDKETVPGNNKPEDKPTPDNKPNNNSSNNGTVDNTKPSDNSNSSTANDNANNSSNNTNNSSTEVKPGNNENTGSNKPVDKPTPDNKPNNNSGNNGTVDNTKPSDNSNSSTANDNANNSSNNTNNSFTEVKPGNNDNTGNNKPVDKPTPDNKPNNNSDNNGTVGNTKPSDNSNSSTANDNPNNSSNNTNNSSTEVKPENNENTGSNKPVDKPTPDNKPNNNSSSGNTNTNNNVSPSENIINNIFSNDASGVKVTLTDKTTAAKLSATTVEDKALANSVLEKLNLPADNQIRILDLKLLDKNNKVVNSKANRTVAIVLKEDEKDVAVYHIKENGELELMKSKIKDGKVTFEIDHFSKFAIVSNKPKQNNGNSGNTSNNSDNASISTDNHDATHNDSNSSNSSNTSHNNSNVGITSTLGHNDSNNKQDSPKVQNNQPTQIAPLNSSVLSSINNSKSGKHLAKTGLSNNNLASLAAIGLVLSGALIFGRRKNRK
ncbi:LPXTG cell wall anchor domain-containing protein [Gemella haemolysans]|uniref:LPXTG cell wall anchor domain-containing protein n=1 Tax=Gemella haemolysans TaxID=1379 RepID=A0AAW6B6X9_9BACL|nr:LPXTG cell wall anchor domain-containing protein [Gemella haemolysans]MDB6186600.1 LPXTG cell wall anchor domain-containing protein [Gemella haemolysans]